MKLLINADDFGYSHEVNLAIVEAFEKGLITNTTIMANMPGFEEAVELSKQYGFFDRVGLHLNLYEGVPLTEAMKTDPIFTKNGEMVSGIMLHTGKKVWKFFLPKATSYAIAEEAKAQMRKYVNAGFSEMHLDSHGHSHTIYSVYRAILPEIKQMGFRSVRKSLNFYGIKRNLLIRIYKNIYNKLISNHFVCTNYFTSERELIQGNWSAFQEEDTCELMVHPGYINGELVNLGHSKFEDIGTLVKELELISYKEVK